MLAPALQLWLRSQFEEMAELQVQIQGGDRQILGGHLPQIRVCARQAVYRGLHLSQVNLVGRQLQLNLGQVWQGKPLKLLAPLVLELQVELTALDLHASLASPLLLEGLQELLWQQLGGEMAMAQGRSQTSAAVMGNGPGPVGDQRGSPRRLKYRRFELDQDQLTLVSTPEDSPWPAIALRTHLNLAHPQTLQLKNIQWLIQHPDQPPTCLSAVKDRQIDLGPEVALEILQVSPAGIYCQGQITVQP